MGLIVRDVGEFWMEFKDFCHYFTDMVLCRLVELSLLWPRCCWREEHVLGEWVHGPAHTPLQGCQWTQSTPAPGRRRTQEHQHHQRANGEKQRKKEKREEPVRPVRGAARMERTREEEMEDEGVEEEIWEREMDKRSRCGGCSNFRETFLNNPQFMFEVGEKEHEVMICLQQEDRRIKRKEGRGENLPIGFAVLRAEVNRTCRVQCFSEQAASSVYMDSRSVTLRVTLGPGRYVIVPSTFHPGVTGRFLLRLFSHTGIKLRELKEDLPAPSLWQCCGPQPCAVTTVHLQRATLLKPPKQPVPHVYAVIRCEEDTVKTRVFKKDGSPEFNTKVIFYRRRPNTKVYITLWRRRLPFDSFLGEARLQIGDSESERYRVVDLRGGQSPAYIYVETSSSQCLTDL